MKYLLNLYLSKSNIMNKINKYKKLEVNYLTII